MNILYYLNDKPEASKIFNDCLKTKYLGDWVNLVHRTYIDYMMSKYKNIKVSLNFKDILRGMDEGDFSKWIDFCVDTYTSIPIWEKVGMLLTEHTTGIYPSKMNRNELIGYFCFLSHIYS